MNSVPLTFNSRRLTRNKSLIPCRTESILHLFLLQLNSVPNSGTLAESSASRSWARSSNFNSLNSRSIIFTANSRIALSRTGDSIENCFSSVTISPALSLTWMFHCTLNKIFRSTILVSAATADRCTKS